MSRMLQQQPLDKKSSVLRSSLITLLIIIVLILLASHFNKTDKSAKPLNYETRYLDGRDYYSSPPLTRMKIPIWNGPYPNRNGQACFLYHGTKVEILKILSSSNYYKQYKIRCGECVGWISEIYLSHNPCEPIGEKIYD